jgi:hypothetical protein
MEQLFKPAGHSLDRFDPLQGLQGGMSLSQVCIYVWVSVCMCLADLLHVYVCMCVCMYIHVCMHVCIM